MEPDPAVSARSHGRVWTWAAIVLAALHFAWLYMHWAPAIMSPDANGYVAQARLIAEQGRTSFTPSSTVQYIGMHWLETPGGIFHSRYPAGLPLAMALAWKVGGLDAALLINPLLGSATVLLVFFLARRVTPGWAALVATAVVAVIPVANQHALDADAHVAATFCLVAGILALLHFGETLRPRVGFVAGLLLGLVPTIRYPEAIVGLTVAAWLLYFVRPRTRFWPAIVGAALPIALLCAHNAVAYGAFWRTGYALTNEQTGFGVGYFFSHVLPYLQNLSGPGLALFFGFGVAGIAALAVEPATRRTGVLFAGIVVPLVMLYMAYYWGAGGGAGAGMGNLRFLLPTLPFLAVGGAWVLAALVERLGAGGRAAAAVVVALQLLLGGGASQQMLAQTRNSIGAAARVRALAEKQIPPGSVLIVDRTLGESLDAVGQWKLIEENFLSFGGGGPRGFGGPGGPGAMGGPGPMGGPPGELGLGGDTPNPQQVGKNRAQQERYAGLRGEERRARIWADVQAWAAGRPVFWFTRSLDVVDNQLPAGADYESLAEVDAPSMFGPGGGGGPPMGGAMPAGPGGRGAPGGFVGGRGMGPGRGGPGQFPKMAGPGGGGPGGRRGGAIAAPNNAKLRLVRVTFGKP